MRIILTFIIVASFLATGCAGGGYKRLMADSGEYSLVELDDQATEVNFSVKFNLTDDYSNSDWRAAAYAGVFEGGNTDASVQFFIVKARVNNEKLVAGYRVIQQGQQVKRGYMKSLPAGQEVKVDISFVNSQVTISLQGVEPVIIETDLQSVSPYVSVSSGAAEYALGV